ncbi:hypothetical protein RG47T_2797 [Mucilaginibacter polytrichastri]|uniref:Uncharacterized protein n=1 Tax=Mucilaginibacter polytrichastri TaxID=1302689 RepID=A0A1Q6A000_9SPHI|nr:hypothetical protein RG47T_2797 [Mucilaginibacter polytrichastri]
MPDGTSAAACLLIMLCDDLVSSLLLFFIRRVKGMAATQAHQFQNFGV